MLFQGLVSKLREGSAMECHEEGDTTGTENQNLTSDTVSMPTCASNSDEQNLHDNDADSNTRKHDTVEQTESSVVDSGALENLICDDSSPDDIKYETSAENADALVSETSDMHVTVGIADCSGKLTVDSSENLVSGNKVDSLDGSYDGASCTSEDNEVSFPAWNGSRLAPGERLASESESGS
jgi:hypothetical protein